MNLTEFLTARLDEDEAEAKRAIYGDAFTQGRPPIGKHWIAYFLMRCPDSPMYIVSDTAGSVTGKYIGDNEGALDSRIARHIARHDPARVLAEVDAKRRMLILASGFERLEEGQWPEAQDIIKALAVPYADHPDYDEDWRP